MGAGPSGLVTAKVLLADGFDVDVYDKASSLGGTWHPDRTYPTLRTNDTREFYRFSDQLLREMEVATRRADNRVAEYFGRCHAERIAGIGAERREEGGPGSGR